MNVTVSSRHCEIPAPLRDATEQRVRRLGRYHPRLADAEVTYQRERVEHTVEIRMSVAGATPLITHGTGATFEAALDRGIDRASRQLRRARERVLQASPAPRV